MSDRIEGPTPVGGSYAVASWRNAAGEEVSAEEATSGEIVEYDDDGFELQRTYIDDDHPAPWDVTPQQDAEGAGVELESQDEIKETWDLWTNDFERPVATLDELVNAMGWAMLSGPQLFPVLCHFLELPAWQAAPEGLKAEAYAWLQNNRQE